MILYRVGRSKSVLPLVVIAVVAGFSGGCANSGGGARANLAGPQKASLWPSIPVPQETVGSRSAVVRDTAATDLPSHRYAGASQGAAPSMGPLYAPPGSARASSPASAVTSAPLPDVPARPMVAGATARGASVGYVSGRLPAKAETPAGQIAPVATPPSVTPPTATPFAAPAPAIAHRPTVSNNVVITEPGETLLEVASRHRVSVSALMTVNGLTRLDVPPGTRLVIPRR